MKDFMNRFLPPINAWATFKGFISTEIPSFYINFTSQILSLPINIKKSLPGKL